MIIEAHQFELPSGDAARAVDLVKRHLGANEQFFANNLRGAALRRNEAQSNRACLGACPL